MRKILLWIVFISLSTICIAQGILWESEREEGKLDPSNKLNKNIFMKKDKFYDSLSKGSQDLDYSKKSVAAVVPHHLLVGNMISNTLKNIAEIQKPNIIVLVGPNHPNKGDKIITGMNDWSTFEGILESDRAFIEEILSKGLATRDEEILSKEYSLGNVIPFVKHFFPEAKVVPIIFHSDADLKKILELSEIIEKNLGKDDLIIASIDFSHYLTSEESLAMDELTMNAISNRNYDMILNMGPDNLDSPPSLVLTLICGDKMGKGNFEILDHDNSGMVLKDPKIKTTSYFNLVFERAD